MRARAKHQHPALEAFAGKLAAEKEARQGEREEGEDGGVEQARPPEGDRREQEEEEGEQKDAEAGRDHQPRGGDPQGMERIGRVEAYPDQRQLDGNGESQHVRQPPGGRVDLAGNLPDAHDPAGFRGKQQQHEVEQPQQQHAVGHIMLEQADHRPASAA
jgi:hypothetical protein